MLLRVIINARNIYRRKAMKVTDPVCKMQIDSEKAAATSEYKGQKIYFCNPGCKAKFDKEPEKYVAEN
jgi:YHS domain-containing protein